VSKPGRFRALQENYRSEARRSRLAAVFFAARFAVDLFLVLV
jgi:hypothetical protein